MNAQMEDKASRKQQASGRAARIQEVREEVIAQRESDGQERFRVEKRNDEWAIIRNSDNHPIYWLNSSQQARATRNLIEKDYAREAQEKAADPAKSRSLVPDAA